MTAEFDEDRFNMAIRKFLKHVGVTSQREIENLVRSGAVEAGELKLRMTLSAEGTPLKHVIEERIALWRYSGRLSLPSSWQALAASFSRAKVEPDLIYVRDGRLITAPGVTADRFGFGAGRAAAWRGNGAQSRQETGRIAAISDELANLYYARAG
jgi:hypothetical protein